MTTATALAVAQPKDADASAPAPPAEGAVSEGGRDGGPFGFLARRNRGGAGDRGWRRSPRWRPAAGGPLPRAAWAAVAAVAVTLLAQLGTAAPGTLRPTAAAAFAVGAAFGPAGILVFALVQAAVLLAIGGPPAVALLIALCDGLLGAVAYLAFRDVERVGRGLPNLASYLTLLAAALLGSLATGLFLAWLGFADRLLLGLGLYAVGNLTAVVLVALPLLLFADYALRPLLIRIDDEAQAPPPERLDETADEHGSADDSEATVFVVRRRESDRHLLWGLAGLVLITLLVAPVAAAVPTIAPWAGMIYLLPVVAAAQSYGLRGGALAASLSGLAFLVALRLAELTIGWSVEEPFHPLPLYAQLLVLSPLGAFLGQAREREARLRRELTLHHRLLRQDLLRVVQALTAAVEAKDSYTESHLKRVADYAVSVGRRLGLGGHQLETLYYGAMLHDIGKIGVPESVLRKGGPLDDEEAALMRQHPEIGARIVAGLDLLCDAAPIVLHHQERWDGGDVDNPGYPEGLVGEAIPLGSRIIAVVDAYDAMTTDRPYRPGRSAEEAAAELDAEAGRQFDPMVVTAFLAVLADRPWR